MCIQGCGSSSLSFIHQPMDLWEQQVDLQDFAPLPTALPLGIPSEKFSWIPLSILQGRNPRGWLRLCQAVTLQFWQWILAPLIPRSECWEGGTSPTRFSYQPRRAPAAHSDPQRASGNVCSSLRPELSDWNVNSKPSQTPVSVSTLNLNICEMNVWLWPSRV